MRTASNTAALALTTSRDLLRRPGALLAWLAIAILLLTLPRVARRALDDGAALAIELALSTIWLYSTLFAGLAGVRGATPGAPIGPAPEILVTPLRRSGYVLGRSAGIVGAVALHAAALLVVAAVAVALASDAHVGPGLPSAIAAGLVQIGLFTALGLAAGALLGAQLGAVVVIAFLVAARTVIPGLAATDAVWAVLLPDPARLDISREIAFERSLGTGAILASLGSGTLQAVALLVIAHMALSRDRLLESVASA